MLPKMWLDNSFSEMPGLHKNNNNNEENYIFGTIHSTLNVIFKMNGTVEVQSLSL
jgi:hypothetical protein